MREDNALGPIAETYDQLQGLSWLRQSTARCPLPNASFASFLRAVLQSVEVGILNLTHLLSRATLALADRDLARTLAALEWSYGFHAVLNSLGQVVQRLGLGEHDRRQGGVGLRDSPALQAYLDQTLRFEGEARAYLSESPPDTDPRHERFCQLILLYHQTLTTWEENLARFHPSPAVESYAHFVGADDLREMVREFALLAETALPQFRALHQIPEALGAEMSDRVAAAIRALREGRLPDAVEHLEVGTALGGPIVLCLEVLAVNLTPTEYHRIRENLGLTSGSHSVTLHFHLFEDLYRQLWEAVVGFLGVEGGAAEECFREIDRQRTQGAEAWLRSHLLTACLGYRGFVRAWRDTHLHLPRCNLGGDGTRSLTGSPDAVTTVRSWRDRAARTDPLLPLARARGLVDGDAVEDLPLGTRVRSPDSFDAELLAQLGARTQRLFPQVQERTGFFARSCPFQRPARREA